MRNIAGIAVAVAALATPVLLATANAQEPRMEKAERTISVSAQGMVTATPDQAAITTGVQTDAATARDALTQNNAVMAKLIEGLKNLGILPKDIQTTAIHVHPRYSNNPRPNRPPAIEGYQAVNNVRILVRDLKKLGEILDASVTLGANQMGGIGFEVSQAELLKDEARRVAMVNALRRAKLYAAAAGVEVGPVLTISESIHMAGPRPQGGMMARAAMAESVPVEAGEQQLSVTVHVTYQLK